MPALQAYHARERELRCVATEIVQEPGSSPDLLMVQDCTEQYALAASDDKFRALAAKWVEGQECHPLLVDRFRTLALLQQVMWCLASPMPAEPTPQRCCCGCVCSLNTPHDLLNFVLPVHSRIPCARDSHFLCGPICQRSSVLLHQCCKQWTHVFSKCHST